MLELKEYQFVPIRGMKVRMPDGYSAYVVNTRGEPYPRILQDSDYEGWNVTLTIDGESKINESVKHLVPFMQRPRNMYTYENNFIFLPDGADFDPEISFGKVIPPHLLNKYEPEFYNMRMEYKKAILDFPIHSNEVMNLCLNNPFTI